MLNFKQETITPLKAHSMLEHTHATGFVNRKISDGSVNRYARDMVSGNWKSNTGEVIKIDTKGAVIDGQNRLAAVIQSDTSIDFWVCRGLDRTVFQFLDQGKPRDLENLMQIDKYPDPRILSVTGKMLWRFQRTLEITGAGSPYANASNFAESESSVFNWIKECEPSIVRVWESYKPLVKKAYAGCGRNIPESLLFFVLYQWNIEDTASSMKIFDYFANRREGVATPHPVVHWATQYADDLKSASLEKTWRHGDLKESIYAVLEEMWAILRDPDANQYWSNKKYITFKKHLQTELEVIRV